MLVNIKVRPDLLLVLMAVMLIVISSITLFKTKPNQSNASVNIGEASFMVEIADDIAKQQLGLGGRKSLPINRGMLFVYDKSAFYVFWMKGMKFPLDIVWIDKDLKIVDMERDVSPDNFPQRYVSHMPAMYVLEVNAGEMLSNGVQIGQQVSISGL